MTNQLAEDQRAVQLHGPGDLRLERIAMPVPPGLGEAMIRVAAVGICGSDLHTYLDGGIGGATVESPIPLGHEFAGIVVAVGRGARDGTGMPLGVGTRVAVDPARPCGRCELCHRGHPNLCANLEFTGLYPIPGALQEYMTLPAECCFPIPDTCDDPSAALLEPLGIAIHAVDLAHLTAGATVAIVGSGTIGLCCLQVARVAGAAQVYSTDHYPWRLDAAARYGATAFSVDEIDPVKAILAATHGRGVDVALECAWSSNDAVAQAVDVLRPGGRLVIVGISGDDQLTFNHSAVRRRGLTIAICRRMKHTYPRAIELVRTGKTDVRGLVTDLVGLDSAPQAFADAARYRRGIIKAVVDPRR